MESIGFVFIRSDGDEVRELTLKGVGMLKQHAVLEVSMGTGIWHWYGHLAWVRVRIN